MAAPYIIKSEVLLLAQRLKPTLTINDIPDVFMDASGEIIENRTKVWEITAEDQYANGEGYAWIMCPISPIVTLTGLQIIFPDTSTQDLDVSGSDREVWFDNATGLIRRINSSVDIGRFPEVFENGPLNAGIQGALFPTGLRNIKISGTFGVGPYQILALLQTMLIFQMLARIYPADFNAADVVSEKIGDYSYKLGNMEYTKDPKNQKKTIEGYIEWLFQQLPRDEYLDMVLAI